MKYGVTIYAKYMVNSNIYTYIPVMKKYNSIQLAVHVMTIKDL